MCWLLGSSSSRETGTSVYVGWIHGHGSACSVSLCINRYQLSKVPSYYPESRVCSLLRTGWYSSQHSFGPAFKVFWGWNKTQSQNTKHQQIWHFFSLLCYRTGERPRLNFVCKDINWGWPLPSSSLTTTPLSAESIWHGLSNGFQVPIIIYHQQVGSRRVTSNWTLRSKPSAHQTVKMSWLVPHSQLHPLCQSLLLQPIMQ